MKQGYFITFEGGEGTGKTTLISRLETALVAMGRDILRTREPGGTPIAESVRAILLSQESAALSSDAELFLYAASRAEHVASTIIPALRLGQVVLCDRFADATFAYQGYGRGLDLGWIDTLNIRSTAGVFPHLTFLLDCPVEVALPRAKSRLAIAEVDEGRFESLDFEFHRRVREGYLKLAKASPERVVVLDAQKSPESVFASAWELLTVRLGSGL